MIDRYTFKESLGEGRLGKVHLAEDKLLKRDVIFREFDISGVADKLEFEKNFLGVVKDLSSIENANVLSVLDAGIDGDFAYLVSESVKGLTLESLLGRKEFSIADVHFMAEQLLETLGELRHIGFFHYHFRLSSVLVHVKASGRKHFLMTDVGYSKLLPLIHGGDTGALMIAPAFAAPELCEGQPRGEVTSLFMIGQLCYAMLADCHPLADLPLAVALAKHKVGELPYVSGYRGGIPSSFRDWMYKLMSPKWEDRPQSVSEALAMMPGDSEMVDGGGVRVMPQSMASIFDAES